MILEACRRAVTWILSLLGVIFFVYPLVADSMPGLLERPNVSIQRVIDAMYLHPMGIFSNVEHLFATMIVTFLMFGAFMVSSGAGDAFINLALAVAGRFRGGPAKVSILGSALFGMASGNPSANVATVGAITIPMMKKIGYSPTFAGAVEAVASTGGPLTPPVLGSTIFLMMAFLDKSYSEMIIATIVPAILFILVSYDD